MLENCPSSTTLGTGKWGGLGRWGAQAGVKHHRKGLNSCRHVLYMLAECLDELERYGGPGGVDMLENCPSSTPLGTGQRGCLGKGGPKEGSNITGRGQNFAGMFYTC